MNAFPWGLQDGKFWCVDSGMITGTGAEGEIPSLVAIVYCREHPTPDPDTHVLDLGRVRFRKTLAPVGLESAVDPPYVVKLRPDLPDWEEYPAASDYGYPAGGLVVESMFLRGSHLVLQLLPVFDFLSLHAQLVMEANLGRHELLPPLQVYWLATFPETPLPFLSATGLPNRFQPNRVARLHVDGSE